MKGSLTGGYVNTSRCRLEVYKTRSTLNAQVSEKEKELADCRTKLQQVEGEVNQLLSEIQRTETKNSKSKVIHPHTFKTTQEQADQCWYRMVN